MVAPRILWRYILRDVFFHSLLGLGLMSLLLVVQNVLRFIEDLLSAGAGWMGLVQLVAVILPSYLAFALPTALLFGILLAFGRMSADGEIVAIRASGVSVPRLLPPVLLLAALAALVTGHLVWEIEPRSHDRMKSLVREFAKSVRIIKPGSFQEFGDHMLYVHEQGDETCPLRGVLIGDFRDDERSLFISAKCGSVVEDTEPEGAGSIGFELTEGSIHFSAVEKKRYRKIRFARMHTTLDLSEFIHAHKRPRDFTFSELLELERQFEAGDPPELRGKTGRAGVQTQIHRRLAFPMASVLLAIVAVPLGIRPLRSGRSAGALTAIAVMGLYWLLFSAGQLAAEGRYAPAWLSVWSPNVVVLLAGFWLIRRTVRGET